MSSSQGFLPLRFSLRQLRIGLTSECGCRFGSAVCLEAAGLPHLSWDALRLY